MSGNQTVSGAPQPQPGLALSPARKLPVSAMIMTKDEERNVAACIESLGWADEVVVFDSFSSDKTVDIARQRGAAVVQRKFDDFSTHKNWALDNIEFRNSWLLLLDADERATPALFAEITQILSAPGEHVGFYIARQNMFGGRWIRHGGMYPDWNLRLLKLGHGRYEARIVHEHMILNGPVGFLKTALVHFNDNKGIEQYIARHNRYSTMEALEIHQQLMGAPRSGLKPSLFAKGPARRRALKNLAHRYLPFVPLVVFVWMYFIKLGFLDGRAGFRYCLLRFFHEYLLQLKLEELRRLAPSNADARPKTRVGAADDSCTAGAAQADGRET